MPRMRNNKQISMNDLDFYGLDSLDDDYELENDNGGELISKFQHINSAEDDFPVNSLEYKKARKRRQNRESAARARARKKITISQVTDEIKDLEVLSDKLTLENAKLKAENDLLKKELEFYKGMIL
jgi:hypothetical protein